MFDKNRSGKTTIQKLTVLVLVLEILSTTLTIYHQVV